MKLIDVVAQNRHNTLRGDGSGRARKLRGEDFYTWFDKAFGIPALEVQTPKTENNMVSRNTTPKNDICAKISGVYHFSPEKTRGAVERPSVLLGQGGFNPFLIPPTPLPTLIPPNDTACKLAPRTYQQNLEILDSWYGRSETLRGASNDKARTDHSGQPPIFSVPVDQLEAGVLYC